MGNVQRGRRRWDHPGTRQCSVLDCGLRRNDEKRGRPNHRHSRESGSLGPAVGLQAMPKMAIGSFIGESPVTHPFGGVLVLPKFYHPAGAGNKAGLFSTWAGSGIPRLPAAFSSYLHSKEQRQGRSWPTRTSPTQRSVRRGALPRCVSGARRLFQD